MTSGDGYSAVNDFLTAARLFEQGEPELVLQWLVPVGLDEDQVHERVHLLVAVGAVLTGLARRNAPRPPPTVPDGTQREATYRQALASVLIDAGERLDTAGIRTLIDCHCASGMGVDSALTDVAVELLTRLAALGGIER